MRTRATVLVAAIVAGCGGRGIDLEVEVRSDLVPGPEFVTVRTDVVRGTTAVRGGRDEYTVRRGDPFHDGVEVARFHGLSAGEVQVTVELVDLSGATVAARSVELSLAASRRVQIVVTRDCASVSCPGESCVGGRCADPACGPDHPDRCPRAECSSATDCPAPADCAYVRCIEGSCLASPAAAGCGPFEYCDPERGCRPHGPMSDAGPVPPADAARDDAGPAPPIDAGCAPVCGGRECGGDGCGGSCGSCSMDSFCDDGRCVASCVAEAEQCDGDDDDCDSRVDESVAPAGACGPETGECTPGSMVCTGGAFVCTGARGPGAEACNALDDDCDARTDEGVLLSFYRDADGDGLGSGAAALACGPPAGHVSRAGDCDDGCRACYPGATEVCDGRNNDCDRDAAIDEGVRSTFYRDADGDGYGSATTMLACSAPSGYVARTGDCDDACGSCRPGGTEVCDGDDNDCDGDTDESGTHCTDAFGATVCPGSTGLRPCPTHPDFYQRCTCSPTGTWTSCVAGCLG